MKPDRQRMKTLLAEAITTLCRNGLSYDSELCVEGLLGITLDNNEIFLVNVNETFKAAAAKDAQSTDSGGVESAKTSAISPPAPVHRSVVPVRRPHYGKSPMYRPGFTPSHHRLHKRSSGFSRTPRPIPTRPKEVVEIKDDDDQTNVEQTGDMSLDLQVENVPGEYSQYEQMTGVTESGRGATSDSEVSQSENYEPPAKRLTVDSQSTEESGDIKDSNKGTDQDNGVAKSESPGDVSSPSRTEKIPVDVTLSLGDEIKIKEEISEITEEIVQYSASSNASQTFISRSNTHSRHAQEYVPLQTGYSPGQHSGSDSSTGGQPGGMRMLVRPTEYPIPTSQDSSPGQGTQMSPVAGCSTWDNNAGSMQNTSGQGSSGAVSQLAAVLAAQIRQGGVKGAGEAGRPGPNSAGGTPQSGVAASYTCMQCGKIFSYKTSYVRHLQRHQGVKKHRCPVCQYASHRSDTMRDHVRAVHRKDYVCSRNRLPFVGMAVEAHGVDAEVMDIQPKQYAIVQQQGSYSEPARYRDVDTGRDVLDASKIVRYEIIGATEEQEMSDSG